MIILQDRLYCFRGIFFKTKRGILMPVKTTAITRAKDKIKKWTALLRKAESELKAALKKETAKKQAPAKKKAAPQKKTRKKAVGKSSRPSKKKVAAKSKVKKTRKAS